MKLYICNKAGKLGNMCGVCPHSMPHEKVQVHNEFCNQWSTCNPDPNTKLKEIKVRCVPVKPLNIK